MRLEQNSRPGIGTHTKTEKQSTNTMKLGIALPRFGDLADPQSISRIAVRAEELGYDSAWILERDADGIPDALTVFAYLSGRTRTIGLGTWLAKGDTAAREFLQRIGSANTVAEGRLAIAVTHPAGYYDGSLAYQVPARLVEVSPDGCQLPVPGTAAVARLQITYQAVEGPRAPFAGSFDQIGRDAARFRALGASELIFDLAYSASVSTVSDFLVHLERLRTAVEPGVALPALHVAEDPFDYIV